jgi:hypothetical protein
MPKHLNKKNSLFDKYFVSRFKSIISMIITISIDIFLGTHFAWKYYGDYIFLLTINHLFMWMSRKLNSF